VSDGEPATAGRVLALALLAVGMGIGAAMARQWMTTRKLGGADAAVPAAGVVAHGLLAVITLVAGVAATIAAT
jgi:hypothetical protein